LWNNSVAMAKTVERDHIDSFLEEIQAELPPDLDLSVEAAVERIMGLSRRLKRMMEETLAERDLTWGEWKLLGVLLHQGEPYRASPGKLAEKLDLSSGAMTNRIDRLEEAGFIRRLPNPNDRRGVKVELTAAGEKVYRQSMAVQASKEALIASALNVREREQLNTLLRRVMIAFEAKERRD
jgi:DNA-binding MarR family transcriptional regulator